MTAGEKTMRSLLAQQSELRMDLARATSKRERAAIIGELRTIDAKIDQTYEWMYTPMGLAEVA